MVSYFMISYLIEILHQWYVTQFVFCDICIFYHLYLLLLVFIRAVRQVKQPPNEPTNQPTNHSVNQSINQHYNVPINHPTQPTI